MTLHYRLSSDPAEIAGARKAVEKFAADAGFPDSAVADVGLCVNEAIANVIRHAYEGRTGQPIELNATATDASLDIALRDWGNGRVPDLSRRPDPLDLRPGGLGLPCMKQLLDNLIYEPQPDGMCLRMTKLKRIP